MERLTSWMLAILTATVILVGGATLDADQDLTQAISADTDSAKLQQLLMQRRQAAAFALCRDEVGPGSLPRWTVNDELTCLQPLSSPIAQGGQP